MVFLSSSSSSYALFAQRGGSPSSSSNVRSDGDGSESFEESLVRRIDHVVEQHKEQEQMLAESKQSLEEVQAEFEASAQGEGGEGAGALESKELPSATSGMIMPPPPPPKPSSPSAPSTPERKPRSAEETTALESPVTPSRKVSLAVPGETAEEKELNAKYGPKTEDEQW